ncbi:MAG: hypothetical protein FD123_3706 [Bacteroidetes bacterium]|nr:MAG: hypothetical protein FD123_3706 [Bacteroidota bacterium]
MKTLVKVTVATLILGSLALESCKKGEGDPALSFRSRKARVAGEWKTTAGSGTSTAGSTTTTWTYDGANYTTTSGSNSVTVARTMNYVFEKAGTYTFTQVTTSTGYSETITQSGTWNFTGGVGEMKNKSQMVMTILSESTVTVIGSSTTTTTDTYTGSDAPSMIADIYQLKNKEMIFKYAGTATSGSSTSSDSGEWTMTQE